MACWWTTFKHDCLQILQKLLEKLTGEKLMVPEVTQSEEGQRNKLRLEVVTMVMTTLMTTKMKILMMASMRILI